MKLFFDASSFVKRYVAEAGSGEVESLCRAADDVAVSILCPVEILSAACRLRRERVIDATQYEHIKSELVADIRDISIIQVDAETVYGAVAAIESSPVKTLDAVHIGCAMAWRPDFFVSSDSQQLTAAKQMGLKVRQV
jgi:hypothetical protein